MCKLTYYVACTVDRFIVRQGGSFDLFLTEGQHLIDLVEAPRNHSGSPLHYPRRPCQE